MAEEVYSFITALDVQLREEQQKEIGFILPHEHIFQNLSQHTDEAFADIDNITIDNVETIRREPQRCFRNLNLNNIEEMHFEMQNLPSHPMCKSKKLLIVEATNNKNGQDVTKLKEISAMINSNIVKGFTFGTDLKKINLQDEKTQILFSAQNILNQVDFEFDLGSNEQKPSFVGEIEISELDLEKNLIHQNVMTAYLHLSKVKQVPILFNFNNKNTPNLKKVISLLQPEHQGRIVFFNPEFIYEQKRIVTVNEGEQMITFTKVLKNFGEIMSLFDQKFTVGFDILRYNYEDLIDIVKILLKKNLSKQILLSNGVKYRSDLTKYGGRGYYAAFDFIKDSEMTDEQVENIFRNNMMAILQWNTFKVKVIEIKQWKCPICGKEQPENIERFTKFGKEFCSIPCMKKGSQ